MADIDILLEKKSFLILNKPGGVLTQAPPGIDSMELRLKRRIKSLRQNPDKKIYVGVPHRLDRPVSGTMVFGKNKVATRQISEQFQSRKVDKFYWAVVQGHVEDDAGTWTDSMRKKPDTAQSEIVSAEHPDAQHAELRFEVLQRAEQVSWLQIQLMTGRTHQIRLQTSHRGFPILGDELYGSSIAFGPQSDDLRTRWISLHARKLAFTCPVSQDRIDVESPLPDCWRDVAGQLPQLADFFHSPKSGDEESTG